MSDEQLRVSEELLAVIRNASAKSRSSGERSITPRALLVALMEDPDLKIPLSSIVNKSKLEALPPSEDEPQATRDTLSFKNPDGTPGLWLNRESFEIFLAGVQRAEGNYLPKHLALGFVAEAVRQPGVLTAISVEPRRLTEAVYRL